MKLVREDPLRTPREQSPEWREEKGHVRQRQRPQGGIVPGGFKISQEAGAAGAESCGGRGSQATRPVAAGACRPGKGHWRVLSTGEASSLILFLK